MYPNYSMNLVLNVGMLRKESWETVVSTIPNIPLDTPPFLLYTKGASFTVDRVEKSGDIKPVRISTISEIQCVRPTFAIKTTNEMHNGDLILIDSIPCHVINAFSHSRITLALSDIVFELIGFSYKGPYYGEELREFINTPEFKNEMLDQMTEELPF